MFCTKCGQEIDNNVKFCPFCGAEVEAPQQEGAYYQPPVEPQVTVENPYQQAPAGQKNKVVAGVLGILLGSLGIHKFYLGYTKPALIMLLCSLLLSWTGIVPAAMGIIGLIEGIMYIVKTDEEFYETYEANQKEWF